MSHYYSHVYNDFSIVPRITYPLPATSLTSKQFKKLHVALYPTVIASKWFNRHFPNQLHYGSHKYSRLGLLNLEVEQGIQKIQILDKCIHHPKHKTQIHAIEDWHQLSSGLSKPFLQTPNQTYSYVSSVWFNNLLQFMAENKMTIMIVNSLRFNIQRRNDKYIMKKKNQKIYFNPILKNETTQIELRPLKPREQYVLLCRIVRRYYNIFGYHST